MVGTAFSRRRANIFARIFASVFRREIGRYELQSRGFLTFLSNNEITASRMEVGKDLERRDSSNTDSNKGES